MVLWPALSPRWSLDRDEHMTADDTHPSTNHAWNTICALTWGKYCNLIYLLYIREKQTENTTSSCDLALRSSVCVCVCVCSDSWQCEELYGYRLCGHSEDNNEDLSLKPHLFSRNPSHSLTTVLHTTHNPPPHTHTERETETRCWRAPFHLCCSEDMRILDMDPITSTKTVWLWMLLSFLFSGNTICFSEFWGFVIHNVTWNINLWSFQWVTMGLF